VLKQCLAPDSVLRFALYSERARTSVVAARTWIKNQNIVDTASGLREARAKLRALPADHPAKPITETPEFSSSADCTTSSLMCRNIASRQYNYKSYLKRLVSSCWGLITQTLRPRSNTPNPFRMTRIRPT